jgi:flagellar basal body P-ring formation protein FlgA
MRRERNRSGPARAQLAAVWCVVLLVALASVVDAATADPARASGRISVGRAATVDGATVRLADVAVLEGNATDFAGVDLGPAPDPGGSRHLDGIAILHKLRAAGLDDGTTRYEIPASVRIARAYQDVSADEIRGTVERDASSVLGPGEELRTVEVGSGARIPPGPYEVRLGAGAAGARGARRRVDVDLVQEGGVVASVPARLDVVANGPVAVLRHAVPRGTVLGSGDVAIEERELTGLSGNLITALADAIGKETRTALSAGTPLTVTALASPLLVRRGDVVTVIIETPGMRLSTPGEALEGGITGARIRIRNRTSQQELSGQVVERGIVLVQY